MTSLRLASWNVNSLRARIDHIDRFIETQRPDVLCLQETKIQDHMFPHKWFAERGYGHCAIAGQKGYHGVAIASRLPFMEQGRIDWCAKGDARHVSVTLAGTGGEPVALHNFYVPAGGEVPDVALNDKFAHKMQFLGEMLDWSTDMAKDSKAILVGDLNVAPLAEDVWSHKQLLNVITHTPLETQTLTEIQQAHGWVDVMRHFVPETEKLFSWWSYRAQDWRLANKGRRLDHIWVSPGLKAGLKEMQVHLDPRSWEKPSDHAPVMTVLTI